MKKIWGRNSTWKVKLKEKADILRAVLEDKYDDSWREGKVLHFMGMAGSMVLLSTSTQSEKEYKVNYHDDTSDFLSPDDFDGVEVILEPL